MVASDLVRAIAHVILGVLLLVGAAHLWQFIVIEAVYGTADAFFYPAFTGLIPDTVSPHRIQQANALLGLTRNGIGMIAPAIAGILVAVVDPGWVFLVDAAAFVVSAWSLARLRIPPTQRSEVDSTFVEQLREGWREFTSRSWVWVTVVTFSIFNLAFTAILVLAPVVAKESLGGAPAFGLISSFAAVGALLGGVVALRMRPKRPLLVSDLALILVALEPLLLARPSPVIAISIAALAGFGAIEFFAAVWYTALQEHIPREAISRVSAYDALGSLVFIPFGFVLVGIAAAHLGVRATLLLASIVLIGSCLGSVAVPGVRNLRGREPKQSVE
jgi:MFS family permease